MTATATHMERHEMRHLRHALGMTQKQLAEALQLDGPYAKHSVRSWENGKRPISGPVAVALRLLHADAKRRGKLVPAPEAEAA